MSIFGKLFKKKTTGAQAVATWENCLEIGQGARYNIEEMFKLLSEVTFVGGIIAQEPVSITMGFFGTMAFTTSHAQTRCKANEVLTEMRGAEKPETATKSWMRSFMPFSFIGRNKTHAPGCSVHP